MEPHADIRHIFFVPHTRLQTQGQQSGLLIATEAVQISLPRKTRRHCFSVDLVFLQIFRTPREAITWAANILHGGKCPVRSPQTYPPAQRAQSYSSPFPPTNTLSHRRQFLGAAEHTPFHLLTRPLFPAASNRVGDHVLTKFWEKLSAAYLRFTALQLTRSYVSNNNESAFTFQRA